jgi:hypothetical protein
MSEQHDLDERLREAFARRAASTTVTERSWDERVATSEWQTEHGSRFRLLLVAAALVALVAGGVGVVIAADKDNGKLAPKVSTSSAPTTAPVRDDNPRIAPPTTMQLGAATNYYRPDSPTANFAATVDAARTSIACGRWHLAAADVVCDSLVGRVVVSASTGVTVHTLYGTDRTDNGYTVPIPINGAAPNRVGGRPAVVSDDGAGHVEVAFEIDAATRVVVEGTGTVEEMLHWAESVRATPLHRPTVPLVAVAHQPRTGPYPVGHPADAWVAVGVDGDAHPCIAIVPSPSGCRALDDTAIGGVADDMLVAGWARPGVTRVEVRNDDSRGVDAAFADTIDLGGTRVFYADTLVDRFVRITAVGYDESGAKLATVVIQEPCTTCE